MGRRKKIQANNQITVTNEDQLQELVGQLRQVTLNIEKYTESKMPEELKTQIQKQLQLIVQSAQKHFKFQDEEQNKENLNSKVERKNNDGKIECKKPLFEVIQKRTFKQIQNKENDIIEPQRRRTQLALFDDIEALKTQEKLEKRFCSASIQLQSINQHVEDELYRFCENGAKEKVQIQQNPSCVRNKVDKIFEIQKEELKQSSTSRKEIFSKIQQERLSTIQSAQEKGLEFIDLVHCAGQTFAQYSNGTVIVFDQAWKSFNYLQTSFAETKFECLPFLQQCCSIKSVYDAVNYFVIRWKSEHIVCQQIARYLLLYSKETLTLVDAIQFRGGIEFFDQLDDGRFFAQQQKSKDNIFIMQAQNNQLTSQHIKSVQKIDSIVAIKSITNISQRYLISTQSSFGIYNLTQLSNELILDKILISSSRIWSSIILPSSRFLVTCMSEIDGYYYHANVYANDCVHADLEYKVPFRDQIGGLKTVKGLEGFVFIPTSKTITVLNVKTRETSILYETSNSDIDFKQNMALTYSRYTQELTLLTVSIRQFGEGAKQERFIERIKYKLAD